MRLKKLVILTALLPMLVTGGILAVLLLQLDATEQSRRYEERARKALSDDLEVADAMMTSSIALLKYAENPNQETLEHVYRVQDRFPPIIEELDAVCITPAARKAAVAAIAAMARFLATSEEIIWTEGRGESDLCPIRSLEIRRVFLPQAEQVTARGDELRRQIIADVQSRPHAALFREGSALRYEQWGLAATVLVTLGMAALLSRAIIRRLSVLQDNSTRLSQGQPLQAPLSGSDEIADLDHTFHAMAAELASVRKREQEAVDNSADVILAVDADNRLRRVRRAVKNWGYAPEQLDGAELSAAMDPGAAEALQSFLTKQRQAPSGTTGSVETKVRKASGESIDVLWSAQYSREEGQLFCVVHDITERKAMELRLAESARREELLLERVPAAVLMFGDDLSVRQVNAAALRLFAVQHADQLLGRPISSLVRFSSSAEGGAAGFIDAVRTRGVGKVIDVQLVVPGSAESQAVLPAEMSVDEIATADGKMFLAVLLDETERQAVGKLKSRLWNLIANEIAAPLATINSRLHKFAAGEHGELSESGAGKVQSAEAESQRLMSLFGELLQVEKTDDLRLSIHKQPCSLSDVIMRAVQAIQSQADAAEVRIESAAAVSSVKLQLDADRLVQVFVNLLTNAIKFSSSGSTISLVVMQVDEDTVAVRVSDQGLGIPESLLGRIFEPFVQARLEDSMIKGGSGLGLAICRRIVEAHGGTISAQNNAPEPGCTFEIRLPA